MRLKIENVKKQEGLIEVGDVAVVNGTPYLVIETSNGFIAKGFDGGSGSTGYHSTLEKLHQSLMNHETVIYRKSEYELVLRKK